MRDQLIQILDNSGLFTGQTGLISRVLTDNLRCDKCEHWQSTAEVCRQLIGEDDNRVPTAPDFFCACWKPKP